MKKEELRELTEAEVKNRLRDSIEELETSSSNTRFGSWKTSKNLKQCVKILRS